MISMPLSTACGVINGELRGANRRFTGCSYDSRALEPEALFIALRGADRDGHDFIPAAYAKGAGAALVERDADYPLPVIRVADARKQSGLLAAHWRAQFELPVIAVTGSNGKTTVKEMLHTILSVNAEVLATRGNLNNDIGVPLTLFRLAPGHAYAVIEMGANHPGEISWLSRLAKPQVALITQCAPAHLEGFGSVDGVAAAKAEIYQELAPGGTAVVNGDDAYAGFWLERTRARRQITFGLNSQADVTATAVELDPASGQTRFELALRGHKATVELGLCGAHNVMNALAAAACCCALDIPLEQVTSGLGQVRAVAGRMQLKPGRHGAGILDDSYNANPGSLRAALEVACAMPGRCWLALGDMGELGAGGAALHEQAGAQARALGVERLYGIGELAAHAVTGFGAGGAHFTEPDDLVEALRAALLPDVVLLVKGSRSMAMERIVGALAQETD